MLPITHFGGGAYPLLPEGRYTRKYREIPGIIRHAKVHSPDVAGRTTPLLTRTNRPVPVERSFQRCFTRQWKKCLWCCAFAPALLADVIVLAGVRLLLAAVVPLLDVSSWQPPAPSHVVLNLWPYATRNPSGTVACSFFTLFNLALVSKIPGVLPGLSRFTFCGGCELLRGALRLSCAV